eukprot:9392789-Lingulodinium_polyedra.AAC.1
MAGAAVASWAGLPACGPGAPLPHNRGRRCLKNRLNRSSPLVRLAPRGLAPRGYPRGARPRGAR